MSDAAPSSTEPVVLDEAGLPMLAVASPNPAAIEAHGIVDRIESFVGNFKFLSAEARAHLGNEFDRLRTHLPKL